MLFIPNRLHISNLSYCFRDLYSCRERAETQSRHIIEEQRINSILRNQVSQLSGMIDQKRPKNFPQPPKAPKILFVKRQLTA